MTTWELLKAPGVAMVIYIYSHVILQALAYTAGKAPPSLPPTNLHPLTLFTQ